MQYAKNNRIDNTKFRAGVSSRRDRHAMSKTEKEGKRRGKGGGRKG
jgi:hypothetical protein